MNTLKITYESKIKLQGKCKLNVIRWQNPGKKFSYLRKDKL